MVYSPKPVKQEMLETAAEFGPFILTDWMLGTVF